MGKISFDHFYTELLPEKIKNQKEDFREQDSEVEKVKSPQRKLESKRIKMEKEVTK